MPRFFIENISNDRAFLSEEDSKHARKSLRMKLGDEIELCDGKGVDYFGEISSLDENGLEIKILSSSPSKSENPFEICLFQGAPKGDKMELIIQKATELGVNSVVPFVSEFCVSRPDEKSALKKQVRYNKIALEASKQSRRGAIPEVKPQLSFGEMVSSLKSFDLVLFFYENAEKSLREALSGFSFRGKKIAILVGSEGGFSKDEVKILEENGVSPLSLGNRILRCETAPLVAISAINFCAGEM